MNFFKNLIDTVKYYFRVLAEYFTIINPSNDPNERYFEDRDNYEYDHDLIWNTQSAVDYFLYKYNSRNNYIDDDSGRELGLGDKIKIVDGKYNAIWEIIGFDTEDDSGKGILMMPERTICETNFDIRAGMHNGFICSTIDDKLYEIERSLRKILGDHLVSRDVELVSELDSNGYAKKTEWVSRGCTIPTRSQLGSYSCEPLDSGEGITKFPILDHEIVNCINNDKFWVREFCGNFNGIKYATTFSDTFRNSKVTDVAGVRPVIYIR